MPRHTFETFKDLGLQGTTFKPRVPPGGYTFCTRVPFSVSVFHCRRVVCACSAGAVGSFSNKPLSPKKRQ